MAETGWMGMEATEQLLGRRVLVAEDEYLIAREIAAALRRAGAAVVGPVPTLDAAMDAVSGSGEALDAALLDINLRGDLVYPVADALVQRGVPVVFATGYDAGTIPDRYAGIRRCDKPAEAGTVIRALRSALAER